MPIVLGNPVPALPLTSELPVFDIGRVPLWVWSYTLLRSTVMLQGGLLVPMALSPTPTVLAGFALVWSVGMVALRKPTMPLMYCVLAITATLVGWMVLDVLVRRWRSPGLGYAIPPATLELAETLVSYHQSLGGPKQPAEEGLWFASMLPATINEKEFVPNGWRIAIEAVTLRMAMVTCIVEAVIATIVASALEKAIISRFRITVGAV